MDYNEMFGGGPMAAFYGLQDRDLSRAKEQQAMESKRLSDLFEQQNRPLQLENQRLVNEGLVTRNQKNSFDFSQEQEMAPFKMDEEKKKFILGAKQADIDGLALEAQRMAYSPDPKVSAEGQRLMMLHKDFIKIREQGKIKEDLVDARTQGQKELEAIKQPNRVALKQIAPARAAGSGGSITESKVLAPLLQEALTLQQAGDTEGANRALGIYQAAKQAQGFGRSDPNAGKPTLSPDGSLGTIPPKAPVQFPGGSAPAQKAQHTLAQVMQMYPGRSAEEVKAAYKKKTGVDLK